MPPKNSRRPAKKLSEFKKLQFELNPSLARELEERQRKQCEQCYYKDISVCHHSGVSKVQINPQSYAIAPYEEKIVNELLAQGMGVGGFAEGMFKEEPNGKKSLVPLDEFGNTLLHEAALHDNQHIKNMSFYCVLNCLKDKNPRNIKGLTPLHIIAQKASQKGNLEICKFILGCVEDKNPKDCRGRTPLHFAAKEGHLSVCKLIMKMISDKNPSCEEGKTPLHLAAVEGHLDICQLLLRNTKNTHPKDKLGWTPLHFASQSGHLIVCQTILNKSKENNPIANDGTTPLHLAALNGHLSVFCLIGESTDWKIDSWWHDVEEIARKLLETFRGNPDEDWWSTIITELK